MKTVKRLLVAAGIAATMVAIPMETASAYWLGPGPGFGPWRNAYIHNPAYRWGSPATRSYIRDLHRYGPAYANWNRHRRYGWWW
jgi:hypothetical protein